MRVIRKNDKIAVASYKLRPAKILDPWNLTTAYAPPMVSHLAGVDITNLSITDTLNDPYAKFKAVDSCGDLWYGFSIDYKDDILHIKDLIVAQPASSYNPTCKTGDMTYFDLTAVMHDLRKNMFGKDPFKASRSGDFYRAIKKALA